MMAGQQEPELTTEDGVLAERGFLLPNQIETIERFNVRLYQVDDDEELKLIERLAADIERDGQLEDVILTPLEDEPGRIVLYSGHRRRRAIALINESRSARNQPLVKVRYRVDREGGDLFRKAIGVNLHRRGFSPMELLMLITKLRTDHGWVGFKGAKRVAEYLNVDIATVTQTEKFGGPDMDDELRLKLHQGVVSAQSAFELLGVHKDKRAEVMQRAEEIQTDRNIDKGIAQVAAGRVSEEQAAEDLKKKKRIENPAVRQAIRETPDSTSAPQPMSRKELLEFILQFDAPAYGHPNGAVRTWVLAMEKLAAGTAGKNGEKVAMEKFDVMVKGADKGTKGPASETEERPRGKSATGKLARRDKGVKKGRKATSKATVRALKTMTALAGKSVIGKSSNGGKRGRPKKVKA